MDPATFLVKWAEGLGYCCVVPSLRSAAETKSRNDTLPFVVNGIRRSWMRSYVALSPASVVVEAVKRRFPNTTLGVRQPALPADSVPQGRSSVTSRYSTSASAPRVGKTGVECGGTRKDNPTTRVTVNRAPFAQRLMKSPSPRSTSPRSNSPPGKRSSTGSATIGSANVGKVANTSVTPTNRRVSFGPPKCIRTPSVTSSGPCSPNSPGHRSVSSATPPTPMAPRTRMIPTEKPDVARAGAMADLRFRQKEVERREVELKQRESQLEQRLFTLGLQARARSG